MLRFGLSAKLDAYGQRQAKSGGQLGVVGWFERADDRFLGSSSRRRLGWPVHALPITATLLYSVGALTLVLALQGRTAGAVYASAWIATGLLLAVVAAGLIECLLARMAPSNRCTAYWILAFILAVPLALLVWAALKIAQDAPSKSGLETAARKNH